jgi:hypothetical protein
MAVQRRVFGHIKTTCLRLSGLLSGRELSKRSNFSANSYSRVQKPPELSVVRTVATDTAVDTGRIRRASGYRSIPLQILPRCEARTRLEAPLHRMRNRERVKPTWSDLNGHTRCSHRLRPRTRKLPMRLPIGAISQHERVRTGVSLYPRLPQTDAEIVRLGGHPIVKYHDTDVGFLCLLPLPVFLEEDEGPDHDVPAASRIGGRGRVDTGSMERPARDGAVGHRVIALEHRDLGGLLLGKPVPLVV